MTATLNCSSAFNFGTRDLTDEFHLITCITEQGRHITVCLDEETSEYEATGLYAKLYYRTEIHALGQLPGMLTHQSAKTHYRLMAQRLAGS